MTHAFEITFIPVPGVPLLSCLTVILPAMAFQGCANEVGLAADTNAEEEPIREWNDDIEAEPIGEWNDDIEAEGCPEGTSSCDDLCVDTASDHSNCGGCGIACDAAKVCNGGRCELECPVDWVDCSGGCADLETDAANCGLCGHACESGSCEGGVCKGIAIDAGGNQPWNIAVDTDCIYWVVRVPPGVYKVSKTGGDPLRLAADGDPNWPEGNMPWGIALKDEYVYFTIDVASTGAVARIQKSGGSIVVCASGLSFPWSIMANESGIYWGYDSTSSAIHRKSSCSEPLEVFASNQDRPVNMAGDGTFIYWVNQASENDDGSVNRLDKNSPGGTVTQLAANQSSPTSIAVDETNAYWTNQGSVGPYAHAIMTVPKNGSRPAEPLASVPGGIPFGVAVDSDYVYWTDLVAGGVTRIAKVDGGDMEAVAADEPGSASLTIDATHVYWVNRDTGMLLKAPK